MYTLQTPLLEVKGIGTKTAQVFEKKNVITVLDLLLWLPLRYEDRSLIVPIDQIPNETFATFRASVTHTNNYYKGKRSIQSATVQDHTAKIKLMWFNNPWIINRLKKNHSYFFSGKKNDRGLIVQPSVEDEKQDTIHTGRLVPIYSTIQSVKPGTLRKILKHILDSVHIPQDYGNRFSLFSLNQTFQQLHFPDNPELVTTARERLALDELLTLIKKSALIKKQWQNKQTKYVLNQSSNHRNLIPNSIPFELTSAQLQAVRDIIQDLRKPIPMNRILVGDVGSGKTVVAAIACWHMIKTGFSAAIIAPTKILAEQHAESIKKLFPDFQIELVTATSKNHSQSKLKNTSSLKTTQPKLYIGTHAIIHQLNTIKPGLIIYDEQHKFGVSQRSPHTNQTHPHLLTMSATPIPRSLMLTIFSHLHISAIDQLPQGKKRITSRLLPETKRNAAYQWIVSKTKQENQTALIVCPFINPSNIPSFENIPSAKNKFDELQKMVSQQTNKQKVTIQIGLLHGQMTEKEKNQITKKLFSQKIDILVTTPIVEVGLDLPAASIIVIEGAERFGMASLHQMRGRVGRRGQQAYCFLFTSSKNSNQRRLQEFCQEHDGLKLAEKDLKRRGAGNLFGTEQHGFDQLQFAQWTNIELISKARRIFNTLEKDTHSWQTLIEQKSKTIVEVTENNSPLAN